MLIRALKGHQWWVVWQVACQYVQISIILDIKPIAKLNLKLKHWRRVDFDSEGEKTTRKDKDELAKGDLANDGGWDEKTANNLIKRREDETRKREAEGA